MKRLKYLEIIFLSLLVGIFFVYCNTKGSETNPSEDNKNNPQTKIYNITQIKINGNSSNNNDNLSVDYLTLKDGYVKLNSAKETGITYITEDQLEALNRVNFYRHIAGVNEVKLDGKINNIAIFHSLYYQNNINSEPSSKDFPHIETNKEDSNYRGMYLADRFDSEGIDRANNWVFEGIAFTKDAKSAIDQLMNSIYHRIPLLQPNVTKIGYSNGGNGGYSNGNAVDVINYLSPGLDGNKIAYYPADGQVDVLKSFVPSTEDPNPLSEDENDLVGSPISVHFQLPTVPHVMKNVSAKLIDENNKEVEIYILSPENDENLYSELFIIPKDSLDSETLYTVTVKATYGSTTFNRTWSFVTGL